MGRPMGCGQVGRAPTTVSEASIQDMCTLACCRVELKLAAPASCPRYRHARQHPNACKPTKPAPVCCSRAAAAAAAAQAAASMHAPPPDLRRIACDACAPPLRLPHCLPQQPSAAAAERQAALLPHLHGCTLGARPALPPAPARWQGHPPGTAHRTSARAPSPVVSKMLQLVKLERSSACRAWWQHCGGTTQQHPGARRHSSGMGCGAQAAPPCRVE